jgi:hypothetical protein
VQVRSSRCSLKAPAADVDSSNVPSDSFPIAGATVNLLLGHATVPEVEVLYAGTQPPMALFGHLGALGFNGLVPTPPPADAIDWQTPDPASGRAFSVRPFAGRAVGRLDVHAAERERALDATRYVLGRLAGSEAPALASVATVNGAANGNGHRPSSTAGDAAPVGGTTASARQDGADAFTLTTPGVPAVGVATAAAPTSSSLVQLEVVLDELSADRARLALSGLAEVTDERVITWTTEQTYRGSTTTTRHRAARLLVELAAGDVDTMRAALAPYRPRSIGVPARG